VRAQQVPYSAKPTEEGGKRESIHHRHAVRCMSMRRMEVAVPAEVKMSPVRMTTGEERKNTHHQAQ